MNKKHGIWTLFSAALLLAGAAWIWISAPAGGTDSQGITSPQAGFRAPDFELPQRQGETVRLSGLSGRIVVLNFWASWCPPCKEEMPTLQALHEHYSSEKVVILTVNTAYQDNEENSLAFLQEHRLTFPVVYDRTGETARLYQVRSMPTTFFIAPDGTISNVVVGGPMAEALLRAEIDSMLREVP